MSDKSYGQELIEQADAEDRPETEATQEWVTEQIGKALAAERNRLAEKIRRVARHGGVGVNVQHALYELADQL